MKGNNPFEDALKGFTAKKKFAPEDAAEFDREEQSQSETIAEPEVSHADKKKGQETAEDEALFSELTKVLGLKKSDPFYYKIYRVITGSRKYDVAFDMNRFLTPKVRECNNPRAQEIADMLLKRGRIATIVSWLQSMTPEGMKFGKGSRELRLENAEKSAKLAGVSLEEIAREHGLEKELDK